MITRYDIMQLQKLEREHLPKLIKYFKNQDRHMSNYSAGMLYIWSKQLDTHFAEVDDCLVLCDRYFGSRYFYWPLSESGDIEAEKQVVNKIERFCRSNCIRLHFTAIPKERLYDLMLMYGADAHVSNIRRWRDYLYNADDSTSSKRTIPTLLSKYTRRNKEVRLRHFYTRWKECSCKKAP